MKKLAGFFRSVRAPRDRLRIDLSGRVVYAVGDVHGCLEKLASLEEKIAADGRSFSEPKLIIMLGDYVDRGPDSAGVLSRLAGSPPAGFERICLAGNHEIAMLDYFEGRCELASWLAMGGKATLASYGIDISRLKDLGSKQRGIDAAIRTAIPREHADFLRSLPVLVEAPRHVFVHAGFRPDIPIEEQDDYTLVTIRREFHDKAGLLRHTVIHGHTPVRKPQLDGKRLNIDTGAYLGRSLTAVRIFRGKGRFIQS